ncbi:hypothetical protein HJFPF1_02128 [Paramyrothecium foliicola]|nr:hypothetical protein HJFPF1_02128 [Paramyrothecium foliicola]
MLPYSPVDQSTMKTTSIVLAATAALSGFASAQDKADYLPECSLDCLNTATEQATDCSLDDAVCWCVQENYENIYDAGVACVLQACGPDRAVTEVLPAAAVFCSAASASASAATATSASSSAAVTSVASSTGASNATVTTAPSTSTDSDDESATTTELTTTTEPGAAAATSYIGGAAMLALGALALF